MQTREDDILRNFQLYSREFIASFIGPAIRRTFYLTVTLGRRLAIAPLRENRVLNKRTSWNWMKNMFLQARTIRVAILLHLDVADVASLTVEEHGNNAFIISP